MNTISIASIRASAADKSIGIILLAMFLAVILGLASALLPSYFVAMLVLMPVIVGLSIAYPVVGLVFVLMVIFQVIPEQYHPRVPFGGGTLRIYDLMIIYLTAVVAIRQLVALQPLFSPLRQFLLPLLYLFACIALSIAYVKIYAPNDRLLSEGRYFIAWMLLPLIVLGINSERSLIWFWRSVLGLAIVMAIYVCLQTFGGIQILNSAKDLSLSTTSAEGSAGVVRSAVGGATYVMVLALFLTINRLTERRWALSAGVPFALLMLAALGASFGRAVWVSTIIGLVVSSFVFRGIRGALLSIVLMAILVTAMVGTAIVVAPQTGQAMVDRVTRLGDEVARGGSFQWRLQENRDAINSIAKHPLLGVGIGGDYKNVNRSHGVFAVETVYIHNAYLYFPVKMGLHATLIPFLFMVAAFLAVKGALGASQPRSDRARVAALAGTFAVLCVVSLNQPEWSAVGGIAALCVTMSLLVLERTYGQASLKLRQR